MAAVPESVRRLADAQHGVVSLEQAVTAGMADDRAQRLVRAGAWQRLHPGVFATYSGPVTWSARSRGALLHAGRGAALSHASAAHVHGIVATPPRTVEVVVPHGRKVVTGRGLRVRQRRQLVIEDRGLPVVPRGTTVLDLVAGARSDDEAVRIVGEALRRRVAAEEILDALHTRARQRHRRLLLDVLAPGSGVESPLEHRYRRDVERRHGLPTAVRQRWDLVEGRWTRADAVYEPYGVRAELDGESGHPGGRTDSDVWRDNAVLVHRSDVTLRYRWSHVVGDPCGTAAQVALALMAGGWGGTPRRCRPGCRAVA